MLGVRAYQVGVTLVAPLLPVLLKRRVKSGREDAARFSEKMARNMAPRPDGHLIWVHAASVGETRSVLPLMGDLLAAHENSHILLTTGTRTSAGLIAQLTPESFANIHRLTHQYLPLDRPRWVRRFLDHWKPQLAVFVESELWPNLLLNMRKRGIPAALVNGRLSAPSFRFWRRAKISAQLLFGCFDTLLAQDALTAERWDQLGLRGYVSTGNLKLDAPVLEVDAHAHLALKDALQNRPVWLAASTHPGEDELIAACHEKLRASYPELLCIIIPRHPERGPEIAAMLKARAHGAARRSSGALPAPDDAFYVGDTLGEMGLFYRLDACVFMGGSLVPHGGQNPLEAARLDNAILCGPHTANFVSVYEALSTDSGVVNVADAHELTAALDRLLCAPEERKQLAAAAQAHEARQGGARASTLSALNHLMARAHA